MTLMFHVALYVLAAVGLLSLPIHGVRVQQHLRHRNHDALMQRIAVLEVESGFGIDWSRDWFEAQPKRTRDECFVMSGTWWCYACGTWHQANGNGFRKACSRAKLDRRPA